MRKHSIFPVATLLAFMSPLFALAQPTVIKQAEIRPMSGTEEGTPVRFYVQLSVSKTDHIKAVHIEFFAGEESRTVSLERTLIREDNRSYVISEGARFPVESNDITFTIQVPNDYDTAMRQARITSIDQSGARSNTLTVQW